MDNAFTELGTLASEIDAQLAKSKAPLSEAFLRGGKAIFTVSREASIAWPSGHHDDDAYALSIRKSKDGKMVFVWLLDKLNPTARQRGIYLGFLADDGISIIPGRRGAVGPRADLARRVCSWTLRHAKLDRPFPAGFRAQHAGRCGRCGRRLTDPVSIERGLGPECATRE